MLDPLSTPNPLSLAVTGDGSPTLYSTQFDAHYHSMHGALQESEHVFIQEGIAYHNGLHEIPEIDILEYGMGTGLNVLLTQRYAEEQQQKVNFHTTEGYPILPEVYRDISYIDGDKETLLKIHDAPWDTTSEISEHFKLYKEHILFEDFTSERKYDVIYYDAFAPSCQPHLWQSAILDVAVALLKPNGFIVTFCAQGAFKRVLKGHGLIVERVPGPPGKREMTRATKS